MNKEIMSIPDAARQCSLNRVTLWKYVKTGALKTSLTPGGQYRVHIHDLEDFMRRRGMYPFGRYEPKIRKILIVDDDPEIQTLLSKIFSINTYQVGIASDGFEAGVKLMSFKPGLVILDLFLPGVDGFELCNRIKSNPETSHVKILAVTGYNIPENRDRILKIGADHYMGKPFDIRLLRQCAESLLNPGGNGNGKKIA